MEFKNDDQLKSKLKKESIRLGVSPQNTYNTFFARYLLSKLAEVNHGELIVKGSFVELVHAKELIRPITDLDLASLLGSTQAIIFLLKSIYESNSEFIFDLSKIPTVSNTGINQFSLLIKNGKINHPLNVDLEPNYKRLFELGYKEVPSIFEGDKPFLISCPSFEEYLAEKMCIVLENNKPNMFDSKIFNTRIKDFYDLYKLHNGEYDEDKLTKFLGKALILRNRMDKNDANTDFLDRNFIVNHQGVWNNASKKYEFLDNSVSFEESVECTKGMLDENIFKLRKSKYFIDKRI